MKKGQFKEIIKECIRELIDEGAFDIALEDVVTESMAVNFSSTLKKQSNEIKELKQKVMQASANRKMKIQEGQKEQSRKAKPDFDLRQVLEGAFLEESEDNARINEHIKNLVETQAMASSKGDKKKANIMREIFADTAVTMVKEKTGEVQKEEMDQLSSLASGGDPGRWGKILNQSMKSKK